jgi:DNA polymerase-4
VLHVDIDAFFASVEQLRNPTLRGKPVAVGSGVVASASYEARRHGLHAGMPLRKARELCPGLVILAGHAAMYRCFSEAIFDICAAYAPALETYLDEAYCDWSGTERLYPDPIRVAAEIKERILREVGLRVTAGLGRNRMIAKMTSKLAKPDGLRRVLPEEEESFLPGLPLGRLPGVGPRTEQLLTKLNLHTIGDLRKLSRDSLRNMLGAAGVVLHERCRGEDTQPVSPREIPRSIRRETSFHRDTIDPEEIEGTLYYLTERAANTLRELRLETRSLGVKIRYSDFREEAASRRFPVCTQLDSELFTCARNIFRTLHARRVALRLVGITISDLRPDRGLRQAELFASEMPWETDAASHVPALDIRSAAERHLGHQRRELRLLESLDAIRKRYGYASVVCGKSLHLLGKLPQDDHGFILRTSSLTR